MHRVVSKCFRLRKLTGYRSRHERYWLDAKDDMVKVQPVKPGTVLLMPPILLRCWLTALPDTFGYRSRPHAV
jgi:hypothetical protein